MTEQVVLDADFIQAIIGYEEGDGEDLFRRVFRALGKSPVVHPFVAQHEFEVHSRKEIPIIFQSLIQHGDLTVIPYSSFLPPQHKILEQHYRKRFRDMYEFFRETYVTKKGEYKLPPLDPQIDIFWRRAGRSFGEIHSMLMTEDLGIPKFYSNDGGAKQVATYYAEWPLEVQNAIEVAALLKESGSRVTRDERRAIESSCK